PATASTCVPTCGRLALRGSPHATRHPPARSGNRPFPTGRPGAVASIVPAGEDGAHSHPGDTMQIRGPQTPEHQFRPHAPTRRPSESATPAPPGLASLDPEVLGADGLLDLQRSAGNAATEELIDGARSPVLDLLASSSGSPLEEDTRTEMETRMGHDFSDVRVHTGGAADASSRAVQAHAYTVGSDIVFASGRYQPDSDSGRHLLAHEL